MDNLSKSALSAYREIITRYVFNRSKRDFLSAKSCVKWLNNHREDNDLLALKTDKDGLLLMPILADEKEAQKKGYKTLWIKSTKIIPNLTIDDIKVIYTPGTGIKLIKMNDLYAVPSGTTGIVTHVDDIGTIHVNWLDGRTLGVCLNDGDLVEINEYAGGRAKNLFSDLIAM